MFPERKPRIWYLYGKKNEGDNWTLLAYECTSTPSGAGTENILPNTNLTPVNYKFNKANPKDFRFFRFEIESNWSSDYTSFIQLAEFQFTYDD